MQEPRKTSWILVPGHLGKELDVIRVVRTGEDRLLDLGQVDLDDRGILGVFVGFQQVRLRPARSRRRRSAFCRVCCVLVAVG